MIDLNQLLCDASLDPATTLCMRHRPAEAGSRRAFLWVAGEQLDLFSMSQRMHRLREEKQLKKASHLAAFIGHEAGQALFVGIYRNDGHRHTSFQERQTDPDWMKLVDDGFNNGPGKSLWFDLARTDHLADWSGKLIVKWTSERSWSRWANYAKSGHGGNKQLRTRKPENLRFSILERVSPDTPADDVIRLEGTWKNHLHTREFGLNEN